MEWYHLHQFRSWFSSLFQGQGLQICSPSQHTFGISSFFEIYFKFLRSTSWRTLLNGEPNGRILSPGPLVTVGWNWNAFKDLGLPSVWLICLASCTISGILCLCILNSLARLVLYEFQNFTEWLVFCWCHHKPFLAWGVAELDPNLQLVRNMRTIPCS